MRLSWCDIRARPLLPCGGGPRSSIPLRASHAERGVTSCGWWPERPGRGSGGQSPSKDPPWSMDTRTFRSDQAGIKTSYTEDVPLTGPRQLRVPVTAVHKLQGSGTKTEKISKSTTLVLYRTSSWVPKCRYGRYPVHNAEDESNNTDSGGYGGVPGGSLAGALRLENDRACGWDMGGCASSYG